MYNIENGKKKMRFSFFPGFINLFMLAVLAFDFAAHIGSGSVEASMRGGVFKVVLFLGALSASLCIHLQAHKPKGGGVSDIPTVLLPFSGYSG